MVDLLELPDDMDWLMRPVLEGMCSFESLKDGTLDLEDLALMNEALTVRDENRARVDDAMRDKRN